jgi:hypothetical protein
MIWTRIPIPIDNAADRRELLAILATVGLAVREVRERSGPKSGVYHRYVEYSSGEEKCPA